eukprot:CAMPEP_0183742790 /NCGR_PEP_ID=MMETSP0737-20130205/64880_1 /TAXON_ID=385413 /ORGANISM="Thalassiosira miniscula, Strain CCMP1093" /LENGTH=720 /DNA_ID=CAMNT_0025978383 /DNA_START=841 /DNA_END=3004 /DNA_ORIENTATION=-
MTQRDISAFWTLASKLANTRIKDQVQEKMGIQRVENVLVHTLEMIQRFGCRDLAQTTLGIAKIVKSIERSGRRPSDSLGQILHDIFIGDNSTCKEIIFKEIAVASMHILPEFDARHLSNLIYAFGIVEWSHATMGESHPKLFQKVANHITAQHNLDSFKPQEPWSNSPDIFVGDNSTWKELIFKEIAVASMRILPDFDARELSNLIYAFGIVEFSPMFEDGSIFFDLVALEAIPQLKTYNSHDISNLLYAYANMKAKSSQLFLESGDVIVAQHNLDSFKPQAISNIAWSYATMGESHPKLFRKVANHITVSNIAWSYATMGESHPKLFKKVANHIVALDSLGKFTPQALSNIAWSYATMGESHPKLFKKIAIHIVGQQNVYSFKPQSLANITWAFASAGLPNSQLFRKVAEHIVALDNLGQFNPQAISNTLWAYATIGESHPKLFKKVGNHIVALNSLRAFKPQDYSNIVWAYATAQESHPKLFKKIADAAVTKKNEFSSQQISNTLWAYATNGHIDEHLYQSLALSAAELVDKFNSQGASNVAWAYAVSNVPAPTLFGQNFIDCCMEKQDEFTQEQLSQLHQWSLWQQELNSNISLSSTLQEKCFEAFISQVFHPSALQDDVISHLSSIGLQPVEEKLLQTGYRLDAFMEVNGNKIGIEVDGPFHFLGRKPTGNTILKRRQITNLEGIQVVSVPYWEWDKLKRDSNEKQKYLRSLLCLN